MGVSNTPVEVTNIALDFHDEPPIVVINNEEFRPGDDLGGRYGFTPGTKLDGELLSVLFVLAHRRKAGIPADGWTRAEEIVNFLPGTVTAASSLRIHLGRQLAAYPPHVPSAPNTHAVQYRPPKDVEQEDVPRIAKLPGRHFGRWRGPYRVTPDGKNIVIDRRGFLLLLGSQLAVFADRNDVHGLLASGRELFDEGKLGPAYAAYWRALLVPKEERRGSMILQQIEGFIGLATVTIELGETALGVWAVERAKRWIRMLPGGDNKGVLANLRLTRLASLLYGQGGDARTAFDRAQEYQQFFRLCKGDVRRPAKETPYIATIAQAYTKTERFEEADELFGKAISQLENHGDGQLDLFWLSIFYARRAENAWRRIPTAPALMKAKYGTDARTYVEAGRQYDAGLPRHWQVLVARLRANTLLEIDEPTAALESAQTALDAASEIGALHEQEVLNGILRRCRIAL